MKVRPRTPGGAGRSRARGGAALALVLLLPPHARAQEAEAGRLLSRASCHEALSAWTLGERSDPFPFHLWPDAGALLGPRQAAPTGSEVGLGAAGAWGVLRAGESRPTAEGFRYPGASLERRQRTAWGLLLVRERWGPVAVVGDAVVDGRLRVQAARGVVRAGKVLISGGRAGPWPGTGCVPGLVLSGRGRAEGFGIDTPWLDVPLAGRASISAFVGTLPEASRDNRRPFFLVHRLLWPVGGRVLVGATRAALFGGQGTSVPTTVRTVGLMLLGITDVQGKDSDFENQVASLDLSVRARVRGSAVRFHLEYAADDAGFAFLRVPGVSLGADRITPRPGGSRSVGARLTWIAPSRDDYPEWYRHGALAWGWTDRGVPIGHDLGGEGWGFLVRDDRSSGSGFLVTELFLSRRGGENLLSPRGSGWGLELRSEGRWTVGSWDGNPVGVGWHLDAGRLGGHERLTASVALRYRFGASPPPARGRPASSSFSR